MTETSAPTEKPRRRWLRFSLRTMAVLLTVVCLFLGWIGPKWIDAQREAAIVKKLTKTAALIQYDYQRVLNPGEPDPVPKGPFLLRYLFGKHIFSRVTKVHFHNDSKPNAASPFLPQLKELRSVYFGSGEKLTDATAQALAHCENLSRIGITSGVLSADQLAALSRVESIQHLSLKDESASDECLRQLRRFPNLKSLSISSKLTTDAGLDAIADVASLETLEIPYVPLVTDDGMKPLHRLTQLKVLRNDRGFGASNQMTEACLPDICRIRSLEHVSLFFQKPFRPGSGLAFEPAQYEGLESLPHLRHLCLRSSNIQDEALRHIGKLTRLEVLELAGTDITDEGLAHLTNLHQLQYLDIRRTEVTSPGLKHLENLPALASVQFAPFPFHEADAQTLRSMGFTERTGAGRQRWDKPLKPKPNLSGFGR